MIKKILNKLSIPQILVTSFLGLLLVGGTLLMLPISSQSGTFTHFWDAFFTATSALCVTGQITLNTAEHWSYFGRTVIIILIELGGLGLMTLILHFFFVIGRKLNMKQHKIVQEALNLEDLSETKAVLRYVIRIALIFQGAGALVLSFDFIPRLGWIKGIYFSLFHSISAFCNAGFDLFGDSLIGFQSNPLILITIMLLIVIGGLGFIVWRDILTYRKNKRLLLHTRLVLLTTGIILAVSFIAFWISEGRNGTFAHLSFVDKVVNTWFMVITPRTAGYVNVDYNDVSMAGVFMTQILMFIGGSSGSTAGGLKVTTLAILVLTVVSNLKGVETNFQKRSIGPARIRRALILLVIALGFIVSSSFLLMLTQDIPSNFGFEAVLMEVFSCFGTVGLSMGLTAHLNWFGKLVLMILMFVGRVGSMTILLSIGSHDKESGIHYPEESILVG